MVKNPSANAGGRILMDRGAWWATVLGSQRVRHDWSNLAQHTQTQTHSASYRYSREHMYSMHVLHIEHIGFKYIFYRI